VLNQPGRLNIVFIIADDLGYGDLGCYGSTKIRTPNIDRLAADGMRLTRHYSGNAVCAPSRCVLMTGMHPGHAFIRNNRSVARGTVSDSCRDEDAGPAARRGVRCGGFG